MARTMTTTRPACPYPCAGGYCPHIRSDAECISCEHRSTLDAYYQRLEYWEQQQQAREDHTNASHPYNSPALAGWGRQD